MCLWFTAAQLGQKVAVLDYVEPSVKGEIYVLCCHLRKITKTHFLSQHNMCVTIQRS